MPDAMSNYMKSFIRKGDYTLIDATDVFSQSGLISIARKGYNSQLNYDSHFNLMYVYSATNQMPVFYRCPLKSIPFRLGTSYLPEILQMDSFKEKTRLVRENTH